MVKNESSSFETAIKTVLVVKDHTVTGEEFELLKDDELDLLRTFPQPDENSLPRYYQSEKYISHTDSTSTLIERIYQWVKEYMLNKKLLWIEKEKPQKGKILDIGAGTGDFLKVAKKKGWEVFGAEPNAQARTLAQAKEVDLVESTSNLNESTFDVITMWHVLEHVSDLGVQIAELQRLLKKDGLLVIAVPNFKSFDADHYKEFWAAYDVPRHLYHFSRRSIRKIFSKNGFHLLYSEPLLFDSFYVSLLSEKYKNGRNNFLSAFWTGLISNIKAKTSGEYSSIVYFLQKS